MKSKWLAVALLTTVSIIGCATFQTPEPPSAERFTRFSENRPGGGTPRGWEPLIIARSKAVTEYRLVHDSMVDAVVLHAYARRSATGLRHRLAPSARKKARIAWKWRVMRPVDGADSTDRFLEDSPARLLLFFDGDKAKLPLRDRIGFETAELLSGQKPPYATLIYIWSNRQPPEAIIPSAHTGRVKMLVAGSGVDRLGQWKSFERDFRRDFERAFGEVAGDLIGVGILTDTDNTGTETEAYYGDIALH